MKQNKNKKMISGSLILGSIVGLSGLQANASELFNYNDLGSGSEVRSQLLGSERALDNALELSCGEKSEGKTSEQKCGEEGKKAKKKEGKATESKCGEEGSKAKSTEKSSSKKESKATESKCGEGKCGEGKCGGL